MRLRDWASTSAVVSGIAAGAGAEGAHVRSPSSHCAAHAGVAAPKQAIPSKQSHSAWRAGLANIVLIALNVLRLPATQAASP